MAASKPILYSAWISSCSFRVRIALNLKGNWIKPLALVSCSTVDGESCPKQGSRSREMGTLGPFLDLLISSSDFGGNGWLATRPPRF